ncbi:ATP-binding protein [Mesorhizobium sp. M0923]|uniref:ATP-binding protein n=1 Tax=Mesorhizobium sp. M0923 TaxID=2957028 RepID=UPI00333D1FCA
MTDLTNEPDATRLIYGLRDTGYNFNTAAADVVDNSIAANATQVNVVLELMNDGRKFVCFGDNGDGMDAAMLFAAMRYGAPARANLASLGKFGLGLKTASTSVCLRLTVISRRGPGDGFAKLAWDLEHVEATNEWVMLSEAVSADELDWFEELCGDRGTLVIWSKCDRLLSKDYDQPGGTQEQAAMRRLSERLREHVALIYYRFLDPADKRERTVSICIDHEKVEPWNPFYPEKAEQVLGKDLQKLEVEMEDRAVEVAHIRAWILPNQRDLSGEERKKARITNRGQGFYIHREGRVIQQGGWLGVFGAVEPHTSLLRVEFDFDHKLDHAFKVDVKKSKILFDPALEDELRRRLQPTYREAGNRYRRKERAAAVERGVDHDSANKVIGNTPSTKKPSVDSFDPASKIATLANNRGPSIRLKVPVETNVDPKNIYVEAVDDITSGNLWEPAMRSGEGTGFVTGVRINKHHDFYQKIYQRAAASGYAVEGIDLLMWAFATAEQNNTNSELEPIFEDMRDEISTNLRRLLREVPLPDDDELIGSDEEA